MVRAGNKSGFTLVELLLVMVILAVIAALSTPALRGFNRARLLPNTSQELVNTARWCQIQAIAEGVTYRLNFDASGGTWSVTKDDGTELNFTPVATNFIPEIYTLPQGITLETDIPKTKDGGEYVSFGPGGRCEMATITLHSDNVSVAVTVDTPLGTYHVVKSAAGG